MKYRSGGHDATEGITVRWGINFDQTSLFWLNKFYETKFYISDHLLTVFETLSCKAGMFAHTATILMVDDESLFLFNEQVIPGE